MISPRFRYALDFYSVESRLLLRAGIFAIKHRFSIQFIVGPQILRSAGLPVEAMLHPFRHKAMIKWPICFSKLIMPDAASASH